ncbi:MAG: hypothetical protein GDA36_12480 [Rhodobacteraceae bacterium]|nr:hypothetical protein [Paracoccaceae bacterium]
MRINHQLGIHKSGVQGWFGGPVFARFVSNAVRIGADDGLTRIDVPVVDTGGWFCRHASVRWGVPGLGSQVYDPLVCFNCLLIGQWHPEAGACVEGAIGFYAVLRSRSLMHLCPMRRPCRFRNALVQGRVHDDLLAGSCRQIEDHGPKR